MIVAKEFKTYNRRFNIGDPVYETDDLGDKSFADLVKNGYLTDGVPVVPSKATRKGFMPLATPQPVATPFAPQPPPEASNALLAAWESNNKVDDKVVYRVNEPNLPDTYGILVEDSGDMVGIQIPGESSVRYYFVRNVDRDTRTASGKYGHQPSGSDQPPDKA